MGRLVVISVVTVVLMATACHLVAPYNATDGGRSRDSADAQKRDVATHDATGSDGSPDARDSSTDSSGAPGDVTVALIDDGSCKTFSSDSARVTLYLNTTVILDSGCIHLGNPSSVADTKLAIPSPVFSQLSAGKYRLLVTVYDGFSCNATSSKGDPRVDSCAEIELQIPTLAVVQLRLKCLGNSSMSHDAAGCLAAP